LEYKIFLEIDLICNFYLGADSVTLNDSRSYHCSALLLYICAMTVIKSYRINPWIYQDPIIFLYRILSVTFVCFFSGDNCFAGYQVQRQGEEASKANEIWRFIDTKSN